MNSIIKSLILDQIDYCLGYITLAAALKLFNNVIVISLQLKSDNNTNYFCESYIVGKFTQILMKQKQEKRSTEVNEKIYSDVQRLMKIKMKRGWKYYMMFINNYLKYKCMLIVMILTQLRLQFRQRLE